MTSHTSSATRRSSNVVEKLPFSMPVKPVTPQSRAALRPVEAGSYVDCAKCGEQVKFQAKLRRLQVICNVYIAGKWDRVEHYHDECYDEVGRPHGDAEMSERMKAAS